MGKCALCRGRKSYPVTHPKQSRNGSLSIQANPDRVAVIVGALGIDNTTDFTVTGITITLEGQPTTSPFLVVSAFTPNIMRVEDCGSAITSALTFAGDGLGNGFSVTEVIELRDQTGD